MTTTAISRMLQRLAAGTAAALALTLVPVTPAQAGDRDDHRWERKYEKRERKHERRERERWERRLERYDDRHGRRDFAIPHRIRAHEWRHYEPYFVRRVWHAPHRAHYVLYRFPVYTPYGVEYRPYWYLGDQLVVSARVPIGPGFTLGVDFGAPLHDDHRYPRRWDDCDD